MIREQDSRTAYIIGEEGVERLRRAHVAVFGVGGVGGYAAEALARAGVGELTLVDSDTVSESNINRQIIATHGAVGRLKVEVFAERIADINPDCKTHAYPVFFTEDVASDFDFSKFDYVVDAIDTVSAKLALAVLCQEAGVPIISSMGAGNKLNPLDFEVADIYETSVCPLARAMRSELKRRGVRSLKVVYSKETPISPKWQKESAASDKRRAPGSISFVPSAAGLIVASEVVKDLL